MKTQSSRQNGGQAKPKSQNQNLKLKVLLIIILAVMFSYTHSSPIFAQSPDPSIWQQSATGLKTQVNIDKKTAGLGFIVEQQTWPLLQIHAGAKAGGYDSLYSSPITLGNISIHGVTGSFTSETADWAHNELDFNQLKVLVSRLSPAMAVQSSSSTIRFLSGGGTLKYVAYPTASGISIQALTTSDTLLNSISASSPWLLVWYGSNSSFTDTKKPLSYPATIRTSEGYQADIPLLFVFENVPSAIKQATGGGVDISFSGSAGYATFLPLYGRETLRSADTETWSGGLPSSVVQKVNWWTNRLCEYPKTVSESYSYDSAADTVNIQENISFINVCGGRAGTKFAPIPPMLAIVKDIPNLVSFSKPVVSANYPTEFGPTLGIENVDSYSWSVSGLKKYTNSRRVLGTGEVPTEIQQEFAEEVQKIIGAGHFAPWIFIDNIPRGSERGDMYWANPADVIYHLGEVVEVLPDNLKANLINYIKLERTNYPPEDVYHLDPFSGPYYAPVLNGAARGNYSYYRGHVEWYWDRGILDPRCDDCRKDAVLKRVPLYNFFSLSRYYEITGETLSSDLVQKATEALDRDMKEQDWATMYWFKGFSDFYAHPQAVSNANRHFAGLIGFVKLAEMAGDTRAEYLGRALLTKAAVQRLGMAKYPRYLYSANLVKLPPEPDWQVSGITSGQVYNFNWTDPYDDARQALVLDQFGIFLLEYSGRRDLYHWSILNSPYLTAYRDMIPELGRLLSDFAKEDSKILMDKFEALTPHWYSAFSEGILGAEHNLHHPINSFQLFMAKAFIQQESPNKLARYVDEPWLTEGGDLFYVHKLAETIKAYQGWSWSGQGQPTGVPSPTPTHCTPLGDIDCSVKINILDLSILLSSFGKTSSDQGFNSKADLDDSGKIDVIDLTILLTNFGK